MRTVVAVLALGGILLQQGACCCGGADANLWISVAQFLCTSSSPRAHTDRQVSEPGGRHKHCAHHCPHAKPRAPSDDASSSLPLGEHDHHLCLGSHIFYLPAEPIDAVAPWAIVQWLAPNRLDQVSLCHAPCFLRFVPSAELAAIADAPLRAQLQVYLI